MLYEVITPVEKELVFDFLFKNDFPILEPTTIAHPKPIKTRNNFV